MENLLSSKRFNYWCQACGAYDKSGPCDIPGHRSEKLYFNQAFLKFERYSPPRVTEAVQKGQTIEHVKVKP